MEPFVHLPQYQVMICSDKSCRYAVLPSHADQHLWKRHRVLGGKRRAIIDHIMAVPNLMMNEEHLNSDFQNPEPAQPAISHLPVYADGLGCSYIPCRYVCRGKTGITRHYKTVHGWTNPYRRGGAVSSRKARESPWRAGVHCQRFFTQGVSQEYFEITSVLEQTNPDSQAVPESTMAGKVQEELARISQRQEEIARQ